MASNSPDKSSSELTNDSSTERLSLRQRIFSSRRKRSDQKARKEESEKASTSQEEVSQENVSTDSEASKTTDANQTKHEDPSTTNLLTPKPNNPPTPSTTDSQAENSSKEKSKLNGNEPSPPSTSSKRSYSGRIRSRQTNRTSTSEGAMSSSTAVAKPPTPSKAISPSKPSFITRVVYKVVPCVGTTREPMDIDEPSPIPPQRSLADLDDLHHSKEGDKDKDQSTAVPAPEASNEGSTAAQNILHSSDTAPEVILTPPPAEPDAEAKAEVVTSAAVQTPGSTGEITRSTTQSTEDSVDTSFADEPMDAEDEEERLIRNCGAGIPIGPDGQPRPLLPPLKPEHVGRKCLVLDLDETLVHSSFKAVAQADFIVPVEIEYHWHHFHVLKRPGVDNFLKKMGEIYEVVVYTASLSKYADPVLDKLDLHQSVTHRLFRESCYSHKGNYVKDLSQLGRPISEIIILDNSPASYIFNPTNAVPVSSWFNDPHDTELSDMVPFLTDLTGVDDIRGILDGAILSSDSPKQ